MSDVKTTSTNPANNVETIVKGKIFCCLRRKPGMIGLPGQDPAERIYKIGAALDGRTKGNLKGISGELEMKYMPEIVGLSPNDPSFRKSVEEYWSTIGVPVPADEPYLKDYEMGVVLNIRFTLLGESRKQRLAKLVSIEAKVEYLNSQLLAVSGDKENPKPIAVLDFDSISDYLLLNYALKYSKVANTVADVHNSPKIEFYIYEKSVADGAKLTSIELRKKAMSYYEDLESNPRKVNAALLAFGENLADFETDLDKLLRIDELYNENPVKLKLFVETVGDSSWETKYLINQAVVAGKLKQPANTLSYYYNETLLGTDINSAVLYLNDDASGKAIKEALKRELNTQK